MALLRKREPDPYFPGSLRFRNNQVEAAFAAGRQPFLIRSVKPLTLIHIIVSLIVILILMANRRHREEYVYSGMAHTAYLVMGASQVVMLSIMVVALLSLRVWETSCSQRHPIILEGVTILNMVFCMSLWTFSGAETFVQLQGYGLEEVFGDRCASDSRLLLTLDIFVTCTHLGLPVRWFVMAPVELAAVCLYVLVVMLGGSSEPARNIFPNILCLVSLVAISTVAKRAAEAEERRGFLAMISEKALRCNAEFQLSQVDSPKAQQEPEADRRSEADRKSEAVTDRSGAVFDPLFEAKGDKREQLRVLAEKGQSEHWLIEPSEVKLLGEEVLGKGSFGSVQRATFCGMLVAVKRPHLEAMRVPELCNELRVLRHLRHPHIVAAHGAVVLPEQQQVFLVLELIDGVCLTEFIVPRDPQQEPPPAWQRYDVMLGISMALLYMHTRVPHIVHGDIKGSNVMVELSGTGRAFPKVLDFGLSRVVNVRARALGGSLAWMAPEVIDRGPVRCSADIYSFGHVLAFCATGLPPMWHLNSRAAILRALRSKLPEPIFPEGNAFVSLKPLVSECLQRQQHLRPCIAKVHSALLDQASRLESPVPPLRLLAKSMEDAEELRDLSMFSMKTQEPLASLPEEPATPPPAPKPLRCAQPFPELPETCRSSMQATLLAAFRRWNSAEVEGRACCDYHAWFQLCQEVCTESLDCACTTGHLHDGTDPKQCGYCGVLGVPGEVCELCGFRQGAAAPPTLGSSEWSSESYTCLGSESAPSPSMCASL